MGDMNLDVVSLAQSMSQARLGQQLQLASLNRANQAIKEQGREALQLLESVPGAANSGGNGHIDVYA